MFVWGQLMNDGIGRMVVSGLDQMRRTVLGNLRYLQKSPRLISSVVRACHSPCCMTTGQE